MYPCGLCIDYRVAILPATTSLPSGCSYIGHLTNPNVDLDSNLVRYNSDGSVASSLDVKAGSGPISVTMMVILRLVRRLANFSERLLEANFAALSMLGGAIAMRDSDTVHTTFA